MEIFLSAEAWIALATLTFLEIILGIDNIIFVSIVTNKLPAAQQPKARTIGLMMALVFRIGLLFCISWLTGLKSRLFEIFGWGMSVRDIILFAGGLFLMAKSTLEMHKKMETEDEHEIATVSVKQTISSVIAQIIVLDIVFSFDSILTAIGLVESPIIMVLAVILAMIVMIKYAGAISNFIHKYPTMEMLALSFLVLIGVMLVIEGITEGKVHVSKGYIYFAVAFSLIVELINIKMSKKKKKQKIESNELKE